MTQKTRTYQKQWIVFFLTSVFLALTVNVGASLLQMHFPEQSLFYTPDLSFESAVADARTFIFQLMTLCFLQPILEEICFRYALFDRLFPYLIRKSEADNMNSGKRRLTLRSALYSSLLFAVYHGNLLQGIYAFLMGLFLCYTYKKHAGLLSSFTLHASLNLIMLFLVHFRVYPFLCTSLWFFCFLLVALSGIYALFLLDRQERNSDG